MKRIIWLICFCILLIPRTGAGHDTLETGDAAGGKITIEERTGQAIPRNLRFTDESGKQVKLGDFLGKPVILTLVYYTCEHICPQLLAGLAQALPRLAMTPGKDYRMITVSFDETDKPQAAAATKHNYIKAIGTPFPEAAWKFLTGPKESIQDLTGAVGFSYRKDSHGFTHPVVLIFITPEGNISSYFYVTKFQYGAAYPIAFTSFDLNMGLTQAAQGKAVTGFKRALLYCFSHEPPGQSKFFTFIFGMGIVTLVALASFFIYLQISSRKYRQGKAYDIEK
jgi:protein SCO1